MKKKKATHTGGEQHTRTQTSGPRCVAFLGRCCGGSLWGEQISQSARPPSSCLCGLLAAAVGTSDVSGG